MLAHIFKGLPLLLHGEVGTAGAQHLNLGGLNLNSLTRADARHEIAFDAEAGTGGGLLEQLLIELSGISHHLDVLDGRAVVEGDEVNVLWAAVGAYPAHRCDLAARLGCKEVDNLCSLHIWHGRMAVV